MRIPKLGPLENMIVVGDRVLIKPDTSGNRLESGLYLPATVKEKEDIRSGQIIKVGPGYPIPAGHDFDEILKENAQSVKYIPLQAEEGDNVVYLQRQSYEIEYSGDKYVIVPQSAILLIIRDGLKELDL